MIYTSGDAITNWILENILKEHSSGQVRYNSQLRCLAEKTDEDKCNEQDVQQKRNVVLANMSKKR